MCPQRMHRAHAPRPSAEVPRPCYTVYIHVYTLFVQLQAHAIPLASCALFSLRKLMILDSCVKTRNACTFVFAAHHPLQPRHVQLYVADVGTSRAEERMLRASREPLEHCELDDGLVHACWQAANVLRGCRVGADHVG